MSYEANELEATLKSMMIHILAIQGKKHDMSVGELRIYLNTLESEVKSLRNTYSAAEGKDLVQ